MKETMLLLFSPKHPKFILDIYYGFYFINIVPDLFFDYITIILISILLVRFRNENLEECRCLPLIQ